MGEEIDHLPFTDAKYNFKKRRARRENFFVKTSDLTLWKQLEKQAHRHNTKEANERRPHPPKVMLCTLHEIILQFESSSNERCTLRNRFHVPIC